MFKHITFSFGWRHAGLISIWKDSNNILDHWFLHLFPAKQFWIYGKEKNHFDAPIIEWGAGPLFRFGYFIE